MKRAGRPSLFDRRLQLATAVFDAEYKDVQVPGSAGCIDHQAADPNFCGITTNAGKARFRGVEMETNFRAAENLATPGDRLNLSGTLGYLDAKYLQFITSIAGLGPDRRGGLSGRSRIHRNGRSAEHSITIRRWPAGGSMPIRPSPIAAAASSSRSIPRASTSRASRCGTRTSFGDPVATTTSSACTARTC